MRTRKSTSIGNYILALNLVTSEETSAVCVLMKTHGQLHTSVAGDLVLPRVDCCACTLCSVLYVWVYVVNGSLYERWGRWWGFRSVGWYVWCRHMSEGRANQHCGNEPISALGIEPISGWHERHGSVYISSGFWLWYSDHDSFWPSIYTKVNHVCTVLLRPCHWFSYPSYLTK